MAQLLATYPTFVWLALLATGIVIGLLAGLLGIGGGVVAFPVLLECYLLMGIEQGVAVRLAIGTSQASIVVASLGAAVAHWHAGTVDRALVRAWLPALIAGAVIGLALTRVASATTLTFSFAAVAIFLSLSLLRSQAKPLLPMPQGGLRQAPPVAVGLFASAIGVGAGTLSTPVLSLFDFPIKRAIGAGALFNIVVGLPAALAFLIFDHGTPGRPADSVGDVSLFCAAVLSLPALFVAPLAAAWSSRAPAVLLRRLFALCLAAIAVRLLLRM